MHKMPFFKNGEEVTNQIQTQTQIIKANEPENNKINFSERI